MDPIAPVGLQDDDEGTLLEEAVLTLEEDFALSLLLLDSIVLSELQDDGERTLEEDSAKAMLLLDSSLSLGVTGE